jgi:MFS transporter, ACDE family, multidrug resistance protein
LGMEHWQSAFWLYGLGIPLALIATPIFRLSRSNALAAEHQGKPQSLGVVLRHPQTLRLLLGLTLATGIVYGVVIYLPLYLHTTLHTGTGINGMVLATQAIGAALVSAFGVKKLAKWLGAVPAIAFGLGLMAAALVAFPLLGQIAPVLVVSLLFGLGFGIVTPSLYAVLAALTPNQLQSTILSAGIASGFLGQFLAPLILGPVLAYGGIRAVFDTVACAALGTGLLMLLPIRSGANSQN